MGTPCAKALQQNNKNVLDRENIKNRHGFQLIKIVGKGGFGCVWKVLQKKTSKFFALKIMDKARIISKKSVKSIQNQRQILEDIAEEDCKLIVKMQGAFQDRQNLYLLMNFVDAGDLRTYMNRNIHFTENQARFIIRCIVYSIQALHNKNIMHRDIKPQNIIIDSHGYAHITDLGIARYWRPNNSKETSGTPSYMAPEVLTNDNYTFTADYYAIGVIAYELLVQKRPIVSKQKASILQQFAVKQPRVPKRMENIISKECQDFINQLLIRKKTSRLGAKGIQQLLQHPWMRLPLEQQYRFRFQYIKSPIFPFKQYEIQDVQPEQQYKNQRYIEAKILLSNNPQIQQLFADYQYEAHSKINTLQNLNCR